MSELLGLNHVALRQDGPTLSMGVSSGDWVGVFGPAGSGKSNLLSVMAGRERQTQGELTLRCEPAYAEGLSGLKRLRPTLLARKGRGPHVASIATEALLATRLWDTRNDLLFHLSPSQAAAAELLGPFVSGSPLLVLDGQLDRLDPWTLESVLQFLRKLKGQGVALIVASNRPELARHFDTLIVLSNSRLKFAGTPEDLIRSGRAHEFTVVTDDPTAVQALVAPFAVSIEESPEGLILRAAEGQDLAARLLLEGYGTVQFLIHRPPTLEQALLALCD